MNRRIRKLKYVLMSMSIVLSIFHTQNACTDVKKTKESSMETVVPEDVMQKIYERVKTPYKYGVVLKGEDGKMIDCPSVFRANGKWFMVYVCMNVVGYETHLAESDDLLHWKPLGKILTFTKTGWDAWQADLSIALCDYKWGGSYRLQKYEGRYWGVYIGGALQGYETDPLSLGIAWTKDPTKAQEWTRYEGNPVLTIHQPDIRPFETATIYKPYILWDKKETIGYPFVMYYNAKQRETNVERIGMAVSKDMLHWIRFGDGPVVDNGSGISGDPQITRIGDVWVMFYYGAFWKPKAFDTFACSYDMIHWTKWTGPNLVQPSEPWDEQYAHKPWVILHDGVVYHFYCAVGNEGRVIALATSKDLLHKKESLNK